MNKHLQVFLIIVSVVWSIGISADNRKSDWRDDPIHKRWVKVGAMNVTNAPDGSEYRKEQLPKVKLFGLLRAECGVNCPSFSFMCDTNGTVEYVGYSGVDQIGAHSGALPKWRAERLALLALEAKQLATETAYVDRATDQRADFILVQTENEEWVTMNYGNAGPMVLWAFSQIVELNLKYVEWDQAD